MMPVSMCIGALFYPLLQHLSFLTPYLIFCMLLITYSNMRLKEIKPSRMHWWLLVLQLVGSVAVYWIVSFFNPVVAQGALICILTPTATSAVVITSMLGGNVAGLTAYTLLCNMAVAVCAPIIFAVVEPDSSIPFLEAVTVISKNIFLLLLLPLVLDIIIKRFFKRVHFFISRSQSVSFYLWNLALIIVTARTIQFISEQDDNNYYIEAVIAFVALVLCVCQFLVGKTIGSRYNDRIAGGQAFGQKNTILAIWMAQTYLNPISSIGPGAYVLWQNVINSYQIWKKRNNTPE
ncbi:BASS family bile acid:Na+ symporter [Dysgonomonas sp. PH5-45]|uniref:bile acid:sodium symporter n=1 Tax=unclassified Dysgonomonas TaxID=2630389 RepID=UPI00247325B5|nr:MULTISPECIES: transporter [unclassified Dysgonomonas]MDH6354873.1 BASS family bile acid:Na+ symporter [Dysgonomonas sp. PH5-45]MDH6387772.1 BASS family bile acid:Na+ symporter [Dysgonomonas sp. PH5-37]